MSDVFFCAAPQTQLFRLTFEYHLLCIVYRQTCDDDDGCTHFYLWNSPHVCVFFFLLIFGNEWLMRWPYEGLHAFVSHICPVRLRNMYSGKRNTTHRIISMSKPNAYNTYAKLIHDLSLRLILVEIFLIVFSTHDIWIDCYVRWLSTVWISNLLHENAKNKYFQSAKNSLNFFNLKWKYLFYTINKWNLVCQTKTLFSEHFFSIGFYSNKQLSVSTCEIAWVL